MPITCNETQNFVFFFVVVAIMNTSDFVLGATFAKYGCS